MVKAQPGRAEMQKRDEAGDGGADSAGALHEGFVAVDALVQFLNAARLAVADKPAHVGLEFGKTGENFLFKIGHVEVPVKQVPRRRFRGSSE